MTLRQLTREPSDLGVAGRTIRVCENPAVLAAAADGLDRGCCPPLVCVEGNLSLASRALLTQLTDCGCPIAYHGDFDWGGVRIAEAGMTVDLLDTPTDAQLSRMTRTACATAAGRPYPASPGQQTVGGATSSTPTRRSSTGVRTLGEPQKSSCHPWPGSSPNAQPWLWSCGSPTQKRRSAQRRICAGCAICCSTCRW
ncbi:DUF2399 domain-containing protein [Streptomyces sp. NPDC048637]|uniref:DUF2399 domain-containing protein n=1 Tax=Streptomyces sp. NPDC048637 TaxID=3155636 RepID=UPI00341A17F5